MKLCLGKNNLILNKNTDENIWTPEEISPAVWYDPSDASTVTLSISGIAQLDNKGTLSDADVANGAVTQQPSLSSINGLNAGAYDGIDNTLIKYNNLNIWQQPSMSTFVVASQVDPGGPVTARGIISNAQNGVGRHDITESGKQIVYTRESTVIIFDQALSSGQLYIIETFSDYDGVNTNIYGYQDGTLQSDTNSFVGAPSSPPLEYFKIGHFNSNRFWSGLIGETIILHEVPTTETRQKIEGYLAHKWSLTDNLSATHPYKTVAPKKAPVMLSKPLWTPAEISALAWYDASDLDTITLGVSGVSQWDDKTINEYDLIQPTASIQPQTGINTVNNRNVIYSNQQWVSASIPAGTFPTSMQVTCVIQSSGGPTFTSLFARAIGTNKPAPITRRDDVIIIDNGVGYGIVSTTDIDTYTTPTIISTVANVTHGIEYVNGVEIANAAHSQIYGDLSTSFYIGSRPDLGTKFHGNWGEFILTSELSIQDRQKIEGYLAWKWGLVSNLPSGHPFKTRPPLKGE